MSGQSPPFKRPWLNQNGAAATGEDYKAVKGIFAGGLAAAISVSITYPTEYIKTQLQLDEKGAAKKYDGIIDVVKTTLRHHGFFGLYQGFLPLLCGSVPQVAVRFGVFETLKGLLINPDGHLSSGNTLLCGLGAGICEAICVDTPQETIKIKLINDRRSGNPRYKGFFHGVRLIIKEEGISGIYKGVIPTVMKQSSNQGIRFFVVEKLKDLYRGEDDKKHVPKYLVGIFGAIAGTGSVYGNNPIDVVKTRLQGLEAAKYKNSLDCAVKIWKVEGPFAFYKGTVPRLGRVGTTAAITFMLYDSFMDLFNKIWP